MMRNIYLSPLNNIICKQKTACYIPNGMPSWCGTSFSTELESLTGFSSTQTMPAESITGFFSTQTMPAESRKGFQLGSAGSIGTAVMPLGMTTTFKTYMPMNKTYMPTFKIKKMKQKTGCYIPNGMPSWCGTSFSTELESLTGFFATQTMPAESITGFFSTQTTSAESRKGFQLGSAGSIGTAVMPLGMTTTFKTSKFM